MQEVTFCQAHGTVLYGCLLVGQGQALLCLTGFELGQRILPVSHLHLPDAALCEGSSLVLNERGGGGRMTEGSRGQKGRGCLVAMQIREHFAAHRGLTQLLASCLALHVWLCYKRYMKGYRARSSIRLINSRIPEPNRSLPAKPQKDEQQRFGSISFLYRGQLSKQPE